MAESVQRRFPPHVFPWIVLGGIYLAIAAGMSTAASVPPSPGSNQSIVRNGTPLDILPALEDISVNGTQAVPYLSIEEQILQDAIAHSGSATFDSTIYQHVYAYNTSRANYQYLVNNSADNTRTISYSPDYIGLPEGRYTRVADQIVLDGSLLVVKSPQEKNPLNNQTISSQVGLTASFKIQAELEYVYMTRQGPRSLDIPLLLGGIDLIGWHYGMTIIRPWGWINWNHITAVENEERRLEKTTLDYAGREYVLPLNPYEVYTLGSQGDLLRIELENLVLPFVMCTRVGQLNKINIEMNSTVTVNGSQSGAEVLFMPAEPVLPGFLEDDVIPEPSTLLLLVGGGLLWGCRRRRRHHPEIPPQKSEKPKQPNNTLVLPRERMR